MPDNLLLFEDYSEPSIVVFAPATVGEVNLLRPWVDPAAFVEIVGVDAGVGRMHFYSLNAERSESVPVEHAIGRLCSLKSGTLVVVEWAHLAVPQTPRSLAQLFTGHQLQELYSRLRDRGVTLKLFPHQHSGPRAREWVAHNFPDAVQYGKKSDANDAKALAYYVRYCNQVSLADPPLSFEQAARKQYGRAVVRASNIVLNAERTRGYSGSMFPKVVQLGRIIFKHRNSHFVDKKVSISVASTVATEIDGIPFFFTRNGLPPGAWLWLRDVMQMSPFHHRGGIARSNVMRHRFRSRLKQVAEKHKSPVKVGKKWVVFGHFDERQKQVHAATLKEMRYALLHAYRVGVTEAQRLGFRPYEIITDQLLPEVLHGR
jgi:hypothetical protein